MGEGQKVIMVYQKDQFILRWKWALLIWNNGAGPLEFCEHLPLAERKVMDSFLMDRASCSMTWSWLEYPSVGLLETQQRVHRLAWGSIEWASLPDRKVPPTPSSNCHSLNCHPEPCFSVFPPPACSLDGWCLRSQESFVRTRWKPHLCFRDQANRVPWGKLSALGFWLLLSLSALKNLSVSLDF